MKISVRAAAGAGMLVLTLALAAPAAADIVIEPVPVTFQGARSMSVNVESAVEIFDWDTSEINQDTQSDSDTSGEAPVSVTATASTSYDTSSCSATTTAEASSWQAGDSIHMHTLLEHSSDGNDGGLNVDLAASHDASADMWAFLRVAPTATVLAGQPGRLIVDIGEANLGAFGLGSWWDLSIRDDGGGSVAELLSDNDLPGHYEFDVTVGKTYDVFYMMYGQEWIFPPLAGLLEQEIVFGAVGEVGGSATPGDTNDDGSVDILDYYNLTAQFGGPPGAESADFNDDGVVDSHDFAILRENFGFGVAPAPDAESGAPAPEPATLSLLALGGLALPGRRRRRS